MYCAQNFTRNTHMITINMNRVFFKHPVDVTDLVGAAQWCRQHAV